MALEPGSPSVRLINRVFRVTQKLVKKITNGGTLSRDELRAGELSTQALRSCIADPANAHRVELLIQEAERLSPASFEPRREQRPPPRSHPPRKDNGPRRPPRARPPEKKKSAKVIVKKKPKLGDRGS